MKFDDLNDKNTQKNIWEITIAGALIVLFYTLINNLAVIRNAIVWIFSSTVTFWIGILIALLLNPIRRTIEYKWLGKTKFARRTKRILAVLISVAFLLAFIALFFVVLIPSLFSSIHEFIDSSSGYMQSISNFFEMMNIENEALWNSISTAARTMIETLTTWITGAEGGLAQIYRYGVGVITGIFNFFIGVIIAVYILLDQEKIARHARRIILALFPQKTAERLFYITDLTINTFNSFVAGKALDSLIIGIICYFVLTILQMPYTPLISVVVGITNMIPVFGPFIGAIPSIVLLLLVDPIRSLEFAVFILVLQQIDGNIIGPHILGNAVGLPTLLVIFAITIGGSFFGIFGMFMGVPICSVFHVMFTDWLNRRIDNKTDEASEETEE